MLEAVDSQYLTVCDSFTHSIFFRGQKLCAEIEFLVEDLSISIIVIIRDKGVPWNKNSNKIMSKSLGLVGHR